VQKRTYFASGRATGYSRAMASQVSGLRIVLMVVGLLGLIPLTLLFGVFGFLGGLFFVLLAAMAK
jgi:hypothetical protein